MTVNLVTKVTVWGHDGNLAPGGHGRCPSAFAVASLRKARELDEPTEPTTCRRRIPEPTAAGHRDGGARAAPAFPDGRRVRDRGDAARGNRAAAPDRPRSRSGGRRRGGRQHE